MTRKERRQERRETAPRMIACHVTGELWDGNRYQNCPYCEEREINAWKAAQEWSKHECAWLVQ